jgi:hypothetical protein
LLRVDPSTRPRDARPAQDARKSLARPYKGMVRLYRDGFGARWWFLDGFNVAAL